MRLAPIIEGLQEASRRGQLVLLADEMIERDWWLCPQRANYVMVNKPADDHILVEMPSS